MLTNNNRMLAMNRLEVKPDIGKYCGNRDHSTNTIAVLTSPQSFVGTTPRAEFADRFPR
jgi:hypothetical protein